MKLKTEDIRGTKFDVEVSSEGRFFSSVDGVKIDAPSLEELRKKLMTAQKRKHSNIAIPFAFYEKESWNDKPGKFRMAVAIGIHGANGNTLVKIDGEKSSQQWSHYGNSGQTVPPERGPELKRLNEAVEVAEAALKSFLEEHEFSIKDAVKKAMGEEGDD